MAVSIALYGESGSGKTTQGGELAKYVRKTRGKLTKLYQSDRGGSGSIDHLIDLGLIDRSILLRDDDPWEWLANAVKGSDLSDEYGLAIFDSGTSMGEALLSYITHSNQQVGQQRTQKFKVGKEKDIDIGLNNEAHYGLVQTFLLDMMWESSYLVERDIDILWTFAVHRGETADQEPIVGPQVAGKALTPKLPKWFNYTFRLDQVPVAEAAPRHLLYTMAQPGHTGLAMSFGNARYPLGEGIDDLPSVIEPASLPEVLALIEKGREQARERDRLELGL